MLLQIVTSKPQSAKNWSNVTILAMCCEVISSFVISFVLVLRVRWCRHYKAF